jgi:hypothetical protein
MEHGIVEKIHDGFYELATDGGQVMEPPRKSTAREPDEPVALGDDIPQSVDREDARDVVRKALASIDADGPLEFSEIVEQLGKEHSLGYDMDNRDGAWWKRIVKDGIKANGCEYSNQGWTR